MRSQNCRLRLGVETRGRFVQEEQFGLGDDAERDVESAPLSPGERPDPRTGTRGEPDEFEELLGDSGLAVTLREHARGFQYREHPEVAGFLQHDADPGAPTPPRSPRIFTQTRYLPRIAFPVAFQDLDGRRLARPVGTEDREDLAVADVEIQILHRVQLPVGLRQTARVRRTTDSCAVRKSRVRLSRFRFDLCLQFSQ